MTEFVYPLFIIDKADDNCPDLVKKIYKNKIDAQRAVIRNTRVNIGRPVSFYFTQEALVDRVNPLEDEDEAETIRNWKW